jgi:hypothetical protein
MKTVTETSNQNILSGGTKTCSNCHTEKSVSEFDKNKSKRDGCDSRCKKCVSIAKGKSYKKNKKIEKERAKFKSIVTGQTTDIFIQDIAQSLGSAIKEYLDGTETNFTK